MPKAGKGRTNLAERRHVGLSSPRQLSVTFERPTDSKAASIGFVNEACLPSLRLHDGAASQPTQFRFGDEGVEFVLMPLTIETNFSLKIPGRVDQTKVLESRQRADFCPDLGFQN